MDSEWVSVYSMNQLHKSEILKQYLADNGIAAISVDKRDSNYLFGDIEIYVKRDLVLKAKLLIEKFEQQ